MDLSILVEVQTKEFMNDNMRGNFIITYYIIMSI